MCNIYSYDHEVSVFRWNQLRSHHWIWIFFIFIPDTIISFPALSLNVFGHVGSIRWPLRELRPVIVSLDRYFYKNAFSLTITFKIPWWRRKHDLVRPCWLSIRKTCFSLYFVGQGQVNKGMQGRKRGYCKMKCLIRLIGRWDSDRVWSPPPPLQCEHCLKKS